MERISVRSRADEKGQAGRALGLASRLVGGLLGASFRATARRPGLVLTSLAVMGGAGIFAWNATMQQTVRHPAPLLAGTKAPLPKGDQAKRAEVPATTGATRTDVPVPPPRPSGPDAIGSIIRAAEAPAEGKPRPADAKPRAAEPKARSVEAKPAAAPAAGDAKRAPQPRIASAQKALAKLGYGPIVADGLMGSGTRAALEKFERDKKLPVTGELGPRTAKQLASLSGIAIQ